MEYEEEGIDVASIGFRDNDAQVQLMGGRPFGRHVTPYLTPASPTFPTRRCS